MRNWNTSRSSRSLILLMMFSSYLWGIETAYFPPISGDWQRFHLTYEELKPILTSPERRALRSFHLTYEELKLLFSKCSSSYTTRFHLTYEELKQMRVWAIWDPNAIVFILPMRNWNLCRLRIFFQVYIRFSSYLWGIETRSGLHTLFLCRRRFQLTYERLKHMFCGQIQGNSGNLPLSDRKLTFYESNIISRLVCFSPTRNWNCFAKRKNCTEHKVLLILTGLKRDSHKCALQ